MREEEQEWEEILGGAANLQLVPFGVVEEAPVGSGSFGLDRLEQVLSIVCQ